MDTPAPAPAPPEPTSQSDVLAKLSPADLMEWRKTGEVPVRPPTPDPEPVPPTEDDEPEPDDADPEPEGVVAAPERTISKRQQKLNEKIRQGVEAELARRSALAPQTPPPSAPVAPVSTTEDDPEPNPTDLAKYPGGEYDPKYTRDVNRWDARQERKKESAEAQTRAQRESAETALRTAFKATADVFAARTAADPKFQASLDPALVDALIPAAAVPVGVPMQPINIIAQALIENPETAPDVVAFLSKNPAEVARITRRDVNGVPVFSPLQIIREIGRLEAGLNRTAPQPPNTITSAPPPPTRLGDRTATPADAVDQAVKTGDYAAYKAAADAKDRAARGI